METRGALGYLLAAVGVILLVYWYQNSGLHLKHLTATPFINAFFIISVPLVVVGVYLIISQSHQNT